MMSPSEPTAGPARTRRVPVLGVALLAVGALLLAAAGAYYAYGFFAGRDLDRLAVTAPDPVAETLPAPESQQL